MRDPSHELELAQARLAGVRLRKEKAIRPVDRERLAALERGLADEVEYWRLRFEQLVARKEIEDD